MKTSTGLIRLQGGQTHTIFFEEELWSSKQHVVYIGRIESIPYTVVIKIPLTHEIVTVHKEASVLHRLHGIDGLPRYIGLFTLYEAGEYTNTHALVVQLIDGTDIEKERKALTGTLPDWRTVRDLLLQTATVLSAVHERGIAHCDIKLRNIIREKDDRIIVLDWDNSVDFFHSSGQKDGPIVGTVQYMSQEQVLGEALDHRTDIYSLGAAMGLYAYGPVICQRYIVEDDGSVTERSSHETANAIAGGETIKYDLFPMALSSGEQKFQSILRQMTVLEKEERFQTMHEVIDALQETLN